MAILSCASTTDSGSLAQAQPLLSNITSSVIESQSQQEKVIERLLKNVGSIWAATDQLQAQFPESQLIPIYRRSTQIIESEANTLRLSIGTLESIKGSIATLESIVKDSDDKIKKIGSQLEEAKKEIVAAKEENKSITQKMLRFIIVISVGGLGLSFPLGLFVSRSAGVILGISFLSMLFVANTVLTYLDIIAIVGLCLLGLASLIAIYWYYKTHIALKQVVETAEIAKTVQVDDIYKDGGIADIVQSEDTKKVVRSIRSKSAILTSPKKVKRIKKVNNETTIPQEANGPRGNRSKTNHKRNIVNIKKPD